MTTNWFELEEKEKNPVLNITKIKLKNRLHVPDENGWPYLSSQCASYGELKSIVTLLKADLDKILQQGRAYYSK